MKLCLFCLDITKINSNKEKESTYNQIKKCLLASSGDILDRYIKKGEKFRIICSEESLLGYINYSGIECFISKKTNSTGKEVPVDIFLFIENDSFELGIEKIKEKLKVLLRRKQLKISSEIENIKIYLMDKNTLYTEQIRIISTYEKRGTTSIDRSIRIFYIISVLVFASISIKSKNSSSYFGIYLSFFISSVVSLIIHCINIFFGKEKKLSMDFENIWEFGPPSDFSDIEIKKNIKEPSFDV